MTLLDLFNALPGNNVSSEERQKLLLRIDDLGRALGAPGDWGYNTKLGELTRLLFVQRAALLNADTDKPTSMDSIDPLRRIDIEDGRYEPAMFKVEDGKEIDGRTLKLIAQSHGYDLILKVEEPMDSWDSFAEALALHAPADTLASGHNLIGAWDNEQGDFVLAYVKPNGGVTGRHGGENHLGEIARRLAGAPR